MKNTEKSTRVTFRFPTKTIRQIRNLTKFSQNNKTQVVRRAIEDAHAHLPIGAVAGKSIVK